MKVLIITYYWPPSGGSGVQRWMYFAKHLLAQGHTPIIVTIDPENAAYPSMDATFLKEVEGIEVHYTRGKSILSLYSFLKSGKKNKEIPTGDFGNKRKSSFDQLAGFIRGNFFIPDARVGWNKHAYKTASKLIETNRPDIVITSGPPHSTHLVGLKLKKRYNIKWMADFRDPWKELYYNHLFHRSKLAVKKDDALELKVLNSCDIVLTIGPSMRDLLRSKLIENQQKVHYLYNGFEESLFGGLMKENSDQFTIGYIGLMNATYPYKSLIEALKLQSTASPYRFIFAGKTDEQLTAQFQSIPGLEIENYGMVDHSKAIQFMKNCDLLIVLLPMTGNTKIMVTGKLMEYIATGNPILCIGDKESDAAKLVSSISNSCMADPSEIDKISDFILLVAETKSKDVEFSLPKEFSRAEITKELVELIKK